MKTNSPGESKVHTLSNFLTENIGKDTHKTQQEKSHSNEELAEKLHTIEDAINRLERNERQIRYREGFYIGGNIINSNVNSNSDGNIHNNKSSTEEAINKLIAAIDRLHDMLDKKL